MGTTGRYMIVTPSGRKFVVEPIAERGQRVDGQVFTNGGITGDSVKNAQLGGSIRESESIITEDRFKNIVTLPPGVSPDGFIEQLCSLKTVEEEEALLGLYRK